MHDQDQAAERQHADEQREDGEQTPEHGGALQASFLGADGEDDPQHREKQDEDPQHQHRDAGQAVVDQELLRAGRRHGRAPC